MVKLRCNLGEISNLSLKCVQILNIGSEFKFSIRNPTFCFYERWSFPLLFFAFRKDRPLAPRLADQKPMTAPRPSSDSSNRSQSSSPRAARLNRPERSPSVSSNGSSPKNIPEDSGTESDQMDQKTELLESDNQSVKSDDQEKSEDPEKSDTLSEVDTLEEETQQSDL